MDLTHVDERGAARMVDVGEKPITTRQAIACARVYVQPDTLRRIRENGLKKGDVLATARIAGIQAAKQTASLIPLCHSLPLTGVTVDFVLNEEKSRVEIEASARCEYRTGVEMEALTAASVAALTVYDMCKA
ncbi:cyclic pyranopterin monophosphate synthase MoaC, partial [Eubacteriales bacterium OttesenSCG-928-M02]|nr:cyclic pyranopterin monophosphate synthase MoaC [Eubacteriales bacterium OttesenSCG-928-M02]